MKTGWKTRMVAAGAILALSSLVMAAPGGGGPGFGRGPGRMAHEPGAMGFGPGGAALGPAMAQLNLTYEQKQAIQTICQQSRADANEVVDAIEDARAGLHEAVIGGASEEQIRAAAATLGTAIGNQAVLRAQTVAAARAVLTEEQRKEHDKIRASVPHAGRGMGRPGLDAGFGGGRWGLQSHEGGRFGAQGRPPAQGVAPMQHLRVEQMFQRADANKDGALSMDELKAFHDQVGGGWGLGRRQ